jgi:hypothetical protein
MSPSLRIEICIFICVIGVISHLRMYPPDICNLSPAFV